MENKKINIGIVAAEFNYDVTYAMVELAKEHAKFLNAEVVEVMKVPGTYDIPFGVKILLSKKNIDCIVTLGAVIEGQTDHDDVIAQQASRKIMDLGLEFNKPVALGISGPGMSRLEAHERVDYAKRAVEAAVKMCRIKFASEEKENGEDAKIEEKVKEPKEETHKEKAEAPKEELPNEEAHKEDERWMTSDEFMKNITEWKGKRGRPKKAKGETKAKDRAKRMVIGNKEREKIIEEPREEVHKEEIPKAEAEGWMSADEFMDKLRKGRHTEEERKEKTTKKAERPKKAKSGKKSNIGGKPKKAEGLAEGKKIAEIAEKKIEEPKEELVSAGESANKIEMGIAEEKKKSGKKRGRPKKAKSELKIKGKENTGEPGGPAKLKKIRDEEKGKIIEEIKKNGRITTGEVMKMFNVAKSTAWNAMNELLKEGWIIRKGKKNTSHYVLA